MSVIFKNNPVEIVNGEPRLIDVPNILSDAKVLSAATNACAADSCDANIRVTDDNATDSVATTDSSVTDGRAKTMAYRIMNAHHCDKGDDQLHIKFDALISHDITYVGIIQTARASGLTAFPVPYALTNCHNSLCAVGGTINEDDHVFGLSAAHKYGGIYVPANLAVIHQFARERLVGAGKMILGSDSHTRYGSFGCMGVGEGGGELVKQLLSNTYDIAPPEVVLVWLTGAPKAGVGPHDVALALVKETFVDGRVKNKILEFAGPGVTKLSMDFRAGIDVMTTETSCLSSIWPADDTVKLYYDSLTAVAGFGATSTSTDANANATIATNTNANASANQSQNTGSDTKISISQSAATFTAMNVVDGSYYDAFVQVDLSSIEPMIALPFHPSKAYTIAELKQNAYEIFTQIEDEANVELGGQVTLDLKRNIQADGSISCDQGVIVGCSGGLYENLTAAADILKNGDVGNGYFNLSVYAASEPINLQITKDGTAATLMDAGAVLKPSFCGPCFGAGDTPASNTLSIRHATRNFANREGAKPGNGQVAAVALMDARSIAATALNQGRLTAATELDASVLNTLEAQSTANILQTINAAVYDKRCYFGFGVPNPTYELRLGPNIVDWPKMPALGDNLLLEMVAVIHDPVTTTDELIPSGETSSYRSNPLGLAEFTLSRRVPGYVAAAKATRASAVKLVAGELSSNIGAVLEKLGVSGTDVQLGSSIYATKPGDGSAREQAASCQKVLGGAANVACEYATKRYRSNCINWGLVPFTIAEDAVFDLEPGDYIYVPGLREAILAGKEEFAARIVRVGSFVVAGTAAGIADIAVADTAVSTAAADATTSNAADAADATSATSAADAASATSVGEVQDITLYCRDLNKTEREILASGCLINYYAGR